MSHHDSYGYFFKVKSMKKSIQQSLLFFFLFSAFCSFAQKSDPIYLEIFSLKKKSDHAIILLDKMDLEFKSNGSIEVYRKKQVKVFDEIGVESMTYATTCSPYLKIIDLEMKQIDRSGKEFHRVPFRKFKKTDLGGSDFMDDYDTYYCEVLPADFPFIIEYQERVVYKDYLGIPEWFPLNSYNIGLIHGEFNITYDKDLPLRLDFNNGSLLKSDDWSIEKTIEGKKIVQHISLDGLKSIPKLRYRGNGLKHFPSVAPVLLENECFGLELKSDSWEDIGKVFYALYTEDDTLELPEAFKQRIHQEIEGITNREEIIRKLYRFMQSYTRYVSIQLGVGGWKPFPAKDVVENGYGDCKALTTFMSAIYKEVGIVSYPTLLFSGKNAVVLDENKPNPASFNHVMLAVPNDSDTLYIECTNPNALVGELPYSNYDKDVLMLTPDGGKIVRTPALSMDENQWVNCLEGNLADNGTLHATLTAVKTGKFYSSELHAYRGNSNDKEKSMSADIQSKNFDISKINYQLLESDEGNPCIKMSANLNYHKVYRDLGQKVLMNINFIKWPYAAFKNEDSPFPLCITANVRRVDTISIRLPEKLLSLELDYHFEKESTYGKIKVSREITEGQLTIIRQIELYKGEWLAEKRDDFIAFLKEGYKEACSKIIIPKKE